MALTRFKSRRFSKWLSDDRDGVAIVQDSPFLRLSGELRTRIYEYAFDRTNLEQLQALYAGPKANSASGITFACRQLYHETLHFHLKDTVIPIWSWIAYDALYYQKPGKFSRHPVIRNWEQSRSGFLLQAKREHFTQIAWQICLTRDLARLCEDFTGYAAFSDATGSKIPVKDLYLRVCLCDALRWLHEAPHGVMSFCILLENIAMSFPTIQRIHVIYCGREWPKWVPRLGDVPFPALVNARWQTRSYSGGPWSLDEVRGTERREGQASASVEDETGDTLPAETEDDNELCRLRASITWNASTFEAHPGSAIQQVPWKERAVAIDYYDSFRLYGERCVRNKPPSTSKQRPARPTSALVKQESAANSPTVAKMKSILGTDLIMIKSPFATPRWPPRDMKAMRDGKW